MIQIRNVTAGTSNPVGMALGTKYASTPGYPAYIKLMPGQHIIFHDQALRDWHPVIKQHLVEYMAHGVVKVYAMDSTHIYQDKGSASQYDISAILNADQQHALEAALLVAVDLHAVMNRHFTNLAVHNAVTAEIAAPVPTDLASLLVWLVAAQTAYDGVHRPAVGAHPNLDIVNTPTTVVPINITTAVAALRELYTLYHNHKSWLIQTANELDATAVLTF